MSKMVKPYSGSQFDQLHIVIQFRQMSLSTIVEEESDVGIRFGETQKYAQDVIPITIHIVGKLLESGHF